MFLFGGKSGKSNQAKSFSRVRESLFVPEAIEGVYSQGSEGRIRVKRGPCGGMYIHRLSLCITMYTCVFRAYNRSLHLTYF